MRKAVASLGALAAALLTSTSASADPIVFPKVTTAPTGQQTITIPPFDLDAIAASVASCPLVEVAPSIFVPLPCGNTLKSIPQAVPVVDVPNAVAAPIAVDLRNVGLDGPVKDQKRTGVCYSFALTTTMESSLRKLGRSEVLSPLHVIASGSWDDMWRTSDRGVTLEPIARESAWPYDPIKACRFEHGRDSCEQSYGVKTDSWRSDATLVAERERVKDLGIATVGRAQRLSNAKFGDAAVSALASGRPIYLQLKIDSTVWSYRGIRGGVIPDYDRTNGGHAVAVVGYRTVASGRQFLIHNSWGTSWGERGYAWIGEDTIKRHIMDAVLVDGIVAGEAPKPPPPVVVAPPIVTPPPVRPNPVPTNRCAAGTGLDLGTGRCASLCPSGFAPAFGRCWLG